MLKLLLLFSIVIYYEVYAYSTSSSSSSSSNERSTLKKQYLHAVEVSNEASEKRSSSVEENTPLQAQLVNTNYEFAGKVSSVEENTAMIYEVDENSQKVLSISEEGHHDNTDTGKTTEDPQYKVEIKAGDMADLFGNHQHYNYPASYHDLGRRFILQYPYTEKKKQSIDTKATLGEVLQVLKHKEDAEDHLIPVKAPPELVLAVAKESALFEASKPVDPSDEAIRKDILRTGDYWNAVWKEDVNPKAMLRSIKTSEPGSKKNPLNELAVIKAKIMPGTKLHKLVSVLKEVSPRLLYVINNKDKK